MGEGETGPGDSFDLWKRRLRRLWSDGAAWDICPVGGAAVALPAPCALWSATCAPSRAAPLGRSLGFPRNDSAVQPPFVEGALRQRVTFLSNRPLTRPAKSPGLPARTPLSAPATGKLGATGPRLRSHLTSGEIWRDPTTGGGWPFFSRSPAAPHPAHRPSPLLPSGTGSSPLASRCSCKEEGTRSAAPLPRATARRARLSLPPPAAAAAPTPAARRGAAGEGRRRGGGRSSRRRPALPAQLSALPSQHPPPRSAAAGRTRRRAAPAGARGSGQRPRLRLRRAGGARTAPRPGISTRRRGGGGGEGEARAGAPGRGGLRAARGRHKGGAAVAGDEPPAPPPVPLPVRCVPHPEGRLARRGGGVAQLSAV